MIRGSVSVFVASNKTFYIIYLIAAITASAMGER